MNFISIVLAAPYQPAIGGGVKGQASDIQIISATERDNFLTAEEALDFGLIDRIIAKR